MANKALSVPTIKVNNDVIAIVANSFSYKSGRGETKVASASTGGNNATSVHTQDAETMFATIKFSIRVTTDNLEKLADWQENTAGNTVEAVQRNVSGKNFNLAFRGCSVTMDPDINASADGVIEVEMAGDKLDQ